ncbi:Fibronectin type III domain protein [Gemmata sp. SH-PL17]|uniref:fibronectin type III domain-containing protein n=1 Tax=Gemmata sp. SH-PL17 TaxID=1630693 RepID=UPI00078D500F|nr:fibronectin type III domain-containing protein [Gemmata sp. SH-PL17]AMV24585.1 Fibronectin type III domain protein [Gemmata sp. SH-PL17]
MADRPESLRALVPRQRVARAYHSRGFGVAVRPLPPTGLSGTPTTNSVTLSWTDANAGIATYRAEYSLDGESWSNGGNTAAGGTFVTVGGLTPATLYFFRAFAEVEFNGDSVDSATAPVITVVTSDPPQLPPGVPVGLNTLVLSSERIDLGWTPADDTDQGFEVQYSLHDADTWTSLPLTAPHATGASVTGLVTGTSYDFRVRGFNGFGASDWTPIVTAQTQSPAQAPNAPTNLAVSLPSGGAAATQLNLSWVDNSVNETGFKIERSLNGIDGWTQIDTVLAGVTTYQATGLSSSTTYFFRVRAYNGFGDSAYTLVRSGTTQSGGSSAPAAPTLAQPTSSDATHITLVWVSNATNTESYTVYRGIAPTSMEAIATGLPADTLTYTDPNAGPAGKYWYYAVAAVNGFGEGRSNNRYLQSKPNAPAAPGGTLSATALSPTLVRIDLTANSATNPPAVFLNWQMSTNGEDWPPGDTANVWPQIPDNTTDVQTQGYYNTFQATYGAAPQRFHFAGLTPGSTLWFRAVNANSGAASPPSNVVGPITLPLSPPTITAPTGVTGTALTAVSALVQWTLQTDRVEEGILVERTADNGTTWQVAAPNMYPGCVYLVDSGLAPGATYKWRVTPFTGRTQTGYQTYSYGQSATSTVSAGVTLGGTSGGAPTAPTNLTASAYDDTRVSLEWQLNAEDELGTAIEVSTNGGADWAQLTTVGKWVWSCYVTGLVASSSYQVRTRTFSAGGYSSYSNTVTVSTLAAGHTYTGDLDLAPAPATVMIPPQQLAIYRQMQIDYNNGSPINHGGQQFARIKTLADQSVAYHSSGTTAGLGYLDAWGDVGWYAALMYQITGTAVYAQAAYTMLAANPAGAQSTFGAQLLVRPVWTLRGAPALNFVSATLQQVIMMYDWCQGAWTTNQRANVRAGIEAWIKYTAGWNTKQYTGGVRIGPAQETNHNSFAVGYFGPAFWDALGRAPSAGSWTRQSQFVPYGGLQPAYATQTGSPNNNTFANEVWGTWAQQLSGGTPAESSEYGGKTAVAYALNETAIREARSLAGDNTDYHPLARTAVRESALAQVSEWSPDLLQVYQFGDEGVTHGIGSNGFVRGRHGPLALAGNVSRGNATIGPAALGLAREIYDKNNAAPWGGSTTPYWWYFVRVNPYATTAARSTLPAGHGDPVQGMVTYHTGAGADDSFFACLMNPVNGTDHQAFQFRNHGVYRKGGWALTSPLGYGGPGIYADCSNQMMIGGLGQFGNLFRPNGAVVRGTQRPLAYKFGSAFAYAYCVGETYGPYYDVAVIYGGTPPAFCHEWTPAVVYVPSTDGKSDVVVTFDRVLAQNPILLPNGGGTGTGVGFYATYRASDSLADRTRITSNPVSNVPLGASTTVPASPGTPALKQLIVHAAAVPTINGGGADITWSTAGATGYPSPGSNLKMVPLLPASRVVATYSEAAIFYPPYRDVIAGNANLSTVADGSAYSPEARYQVRVWPSTPWPADTTNTWDTFLNVVFMADVSGGPATQTATLVQDSTGGTKAAGALVTRSAQNDLLVMFGAAPSSGLWPATTFNRVESSGYTVTWTAVAGTTNVVLANLDPAKTWTYTVDGGGAQSLAVSVDWGDAARIGAAGEIQVSGTGSHTIVLTGV